MFKIEVQERMRNTSSCAVTVCAQVCLVCMYSEFLSSFEKKKNTYFYPKELIMRHGFETKNKDVAYLPRTEIRRVRCRRSDGVRAVIGQPNTSFGHCYLCMLYIIIIFLVFNKTRQISKTIQLHRCCYRQIIVI